MPAQPKLPSVRPWISLHVYCQADLDRVLIEAIEPTTRKMIRRGQISSRFFLRYWDGGPHARLRVLPAPSSSPGQTADGLAAEVTAYLARHPSSDVLDPGAYRRLVRSLSTETSGSGYATVLRPNNSVAVVPYLPETDRYGTGLSLTACEEHFAESSELAWSLLGEGLPPGRRADLALSLLIAAWLVVEPDPDRLCGWARGMLDRWDHEGAMGPNLDASATLAAHEEFFARLGARAGEAVEAVLDASRSGGSGPMGQWVDSVQRLVGVLSAETDAGHYRPPRRAFGGLSPAGLGTALSALLPVVDICAHLLCNRLGVQIPNELRLRYVAARACQEWSRQWAS
jgi:hypothetical protein